MGFHSLENYEFKFFLEGLEVPITGVRAQYGQKMNFSVDIAPADFDFKPLCWGLVLVKEKNNPWKVMCTGLYTGHSISKTLSSKKYTLNFKSIYYIYEKMQLLEIVGTNSENIGFGSETRIFFGGSESISLGDIEEFDAMRAGIAEKITGELLEGDLEKFFNFIFEDPRNNEFTSQHLKAFGFNKDKVKVINNEKIKDIARFSIEVLVSTIFQSQASVIEVNQTIQKVMSVFKYDMHHIPSLGPNSEEFTIKPELFLGIPPACNIIFPHETFSYNFNKNFDNVPTRFRMIGHIDPNFISNVFYSPGELSGMINNVEEGRFLTEEEKFRGIVASQRNYNLSELIPTGGLNWDSDQELEDIEDEQIENSSRLSEYMYNEEKYRNINVSVNCKLKLGILPGFGGAILDVPNHLVGYVRSVSHFIDLEGATGGTSIQMGYMRKDNVSSSVLNDWHDSSLFEPDEVGKLFKQYGTDTYYKDELKPTLDENDQINFKESLDHLYDHYKDIPRVANGEEFKRTTPDAKDFLDTLGLEWDGGNKIGEGDDLLNIKIGDVEVSKERRASVKQYLKNVRSEFAYEPF